MSDDKISEIKKTINELSEYYEELKLDFEKMISTIRSMDDNSETKRLAIDATIKSINDTITTIKFHSSVSKRIEAVSSIYDNTLLFCKTKIKELKNMRVKGIK